MADINRTNSPMNLYREDILDSQEELDKAREKLIDEQKKTAPFLVGSIEKVNERIASLDHDLQIISELVIDRKQSTLRHDDEVSSSLSNQKQQQQQKALTSIVIPKLKHPPKTNESSKKILKEKGETKPKLVELHQYAGYESCRLTPLPDLEVLTIIRRVTNAQTGLNCKPNYKPEFRRLFFSKMSEAVLVDTFWWFFLHRYHPNKNTQEKIFNRVAHNYVKLLLSAKNPKYRDVFFQDYSDLVAQAIYSAFCAAFPNSWRQFNQDFKSDLCSLTSQWIVGTRPRPRTWLSWNYPALEPQNMKREEFMKTDKKGGIFNFDTPTSEDNLHSHPAVKTTNDNQPPQQNRLTSHPGPNEALSVAAQATGILPQDSDFMSISTVARAQQAPLPLRGAPRINRGGSVVTGIRGKTGGSVLLPIGEDPTPIAAVERKGATTQRGKNGNRGLGREPGMLESTGVGAKAVQGSDSKQRNAVDVQSSRSTVQSLARPRNGRNIAESHPIGEGATFSKVIFNSNGQSPLVLHFLRQKGLDQTVGIDNLLRRTEINKHPPLDAPTYRQLIQDTFHSVREMDKTYQLLHEEGVKVHTQFLKRQRQNLKQHTRREESLMACPHEIKRLSDLLVLELLKDEDEVNTGAAQAVEEALLQQDQT